MRTHALALVMLLPLLAPAALAKGKADNLLANGGFEKKLDSWMFVNNSGTARAVIDTQTRKEGKQALHIAKTGGAPFDLLRTNINKVVPGTRVKVSAQVMGKKVGSAFLKFWVYDKEGESLIRDVDIVRLSGSFKWKKYAKSYRLPKRAASAAFMLLMVTDGQLWVDDVRVEGQGAAPGLDDKTRKWLDGNAQAIKSLAFDAPLDDLQFFQQVLEGVRIVQLGEISHGDGSCFQAKARIARFLHEKMDFNVIVFEAGLLECDLANRLLAEGKVRDAIFASVPGVWRVAEVKPLFEYMARSIKSSRPLRLAGFDHQATGGSALELGPQLGELFQDEKVVNDEAKELLTQTVRQIWDGKFKPTSKQQKRLSTVFDGIEQAFAERREALINEHGERRTDLLSRALGNLRQEVNSKIKPAKGGAGQKNARDARMAENLLWLAKTHYPDQKLITWGATFHLMHGADGIREGSKKTYKDTLPMGQAVHETYGDKVYTIGFGAHHGQKGTPFWGPFPIPECSQGSIEDQLHRYGESLLFVDLRPRGVFHRKLSCGALGYNWGLMAEWPRVFDGFFFLDENRPSSIIPR